MKEELKISRNILNHRGFPPKLISKYHAFIWQLLKQPESCNWGNEIKIAKELFILFPEMKFWGCLDLGFYLRSLAWLKGATGQKLLYEKIDRWKHDKKINFREPKATEYDDHKHGKSIYQKKEKPLSNMEFLMKNGKKTK